MTTQKNIVITGASGFIGSHLVRSAMDKGYHVYAMVRKSSHTGELKKLGADILYADMLNSESIKNALEQLVHSNICIDYVIHAAALTKAKTDNEFTEVNCKGTHHMLSALKMAGISPEKFVFISSLAACGPQTLGNTIETNHRQPITRYGKSKSEAEIIVSAYSNKIPYIILRPTAVYGPGEKDLYTVFKMVNKGLNPVLGSNKQELTFIYVSDLAEFVMASLVAKEKNKTYFITDGFVYSKHALGDAISNSLHKKSLTITLPLFLVRSLAFVSQYTSSLLNKQSALNLEKYKELTAQSWNCNVTETFSELNYIPQYSLQKGVNETTRWYKEHKWI